MPRKPYPDSTAHMRHEWSYSGHISRSKYHLFHLLQYFSHPSPRNLQAISESRLGILNWVLLL
uniref:Uncharacterized protein n=1 Tax=Cannabis sativa TaxID=3483 RepID=A0A803QWM6_CANSA